MIRPDSESPLTIGMFADMYRPHVSGVTNQIELYKAAFEARGHTVIVFTWGAEQAGDAESGIVRSPGIPWGDTGWQVPLGVSAEARRLMATLDVAHAHHPLAARAALRFTDGAPVFFTNHTRYDLFGERYAWFVPSALRDPAVRWYLTRLGAALSGVLVPTPRIATWVEAWGIDPARVHVFPNAIDTEWFAHPHDPLTKTELGLPHDSFVVAHVGRLASEKNLGLLQQAVIRAMAADPSIRLLVVGDGPERAPMERALSAVADRVRFLGMTGHDRLPSVLAAADVFATASTTETFGLVVLEAAAAGLPCVGIESPGVGELVDDGVTGLLVAEDADCFAGALISLAADPATAASMGRAAGESSRRFDVRSTADSLLALYRSAPKRS